MLEDKNKNNNISLSVSSSEMLEDKNKNNNISLSVSSSEMLEDKNKNNNISLSVSSSEMLEDKNKNKNKNNISVSPSKMLKVKSKSKSKNNKDIIKSYSKNKKGKSKNKSKSNISFSESNYEIPEDKDKSNSEISKDKDKSNYEIPEDKNNISLSESEILSSELLENNNDISSLENNKNILSEINNSYHYKIKDIDDSYHSKIFKRNGQKMLVGVRKNINNKVNIYGSAKEEEKVEEEVDDKGGYKGKKYDPNYKNKIDNIDKGEKYMKNIEEDENNNLNFFNKMMKYPNDVLYNNSNQILNNPIFKNYNLSVNPLTDDITKIQGIYEDVLPINVSSPSLTFITIRDRIILCDYLRSLYIRDRDGEEINFDNYNKIPNKLYTLLSFIKLKDFNPLHYSKITDNPYKTLPYGLLVWNANYPIYLDRKTNMIQPAKKNIDLNIRLYKLQNIDILAKDQSFSDILKDHESEIWNELYYYEFIKSLIKQNKCSNFVLLYSYYIVKKININFSKIYEGSISKDKKLTDDNIIKLVKSNLDDIKNILKNKNGTTITKTEDLFNDSDQCLLMLTEAPNCNIVQWTEKKYLNNNGNNIIYTMTNTGYHSEKEILSVIFQILVIFHVLKSNEIILSNLNIDNLFIKIVNVDSNISHWKYIINGITYYVPNYGNVVLLDSKYEYNENNGQIYGDQKQSNYKIYHKDLKGNLYNYQEFNKIYEKIIINVFTKLLTLFSKHNDIINKVITNIKSISDLIYDIFYKHYLHNRIGQEITQLEQTQIINGNKNFSDGELVLYKYDEKYYISMIKDNNLSVYTIDLNDTTGKKCAIINCNKEDIYKIYGSIPQTVKPGLKLNEEDILETYYI